METECDDKTLDWTDGFSYTSIDDSGLIDTVLTVHFEHTNPIIGVGGAHEYPQDFTQNVLGKSPLSTPVCNNSDAFDQTSVPM